MFVTGMFMPHVGQRAVIIAALCGLGVALGVAWWTELIWWLGLTEFAELEQAVARVDRPVEVHGGPIQDDLAGGRRLDTRALLSLESG